MLFLTTRRLLSLSGNVSPERAAFVALMTGVSCPAGAIARERVRIEQGANLTIFRSMRLKTKLVLAITGLVLMISGLLSLVYVSHLLHASVEQSYETNRMVANQVQWRCRMRCKPGLKDRKFDPTKPYELRELAAEAIRGSEPLKVVIDSVNLYSVDRLRHQHRRHDQAHYPAAAILKTRTNLFLPVPTSRICKMPIPSG